ncbi:hypothetical protein SARC_15699, partial [Sphaeroforma arctica JP610]
MPDILTPKRKQSDVLFQLGQDHSDWSDGEVGHEGEAEAVVVGNKRSIASQTDGAGYTKLA